MSEKKSTKHFAYSDDPEAQWPQMLYQAVHNENEKHKLYVQNRNINGVPKTYIDLTTMQRLNLYDLQRRLMVTVNQIVGAQEGNRQVPQKTMDEISALLSSYFAALRDAKWVRKSLQDPEFRYSIMDYLSLQLDSPGTGSMFASTGLVTGPGMAISDACLPRIPEHWAFDGLFLADKQRARRAFRMRLWMAAFGGAALVAPMLIMTLHRSKVTSLVTTSVFVTVVGAILARFMTDATPKDILERRQRTQLSW